MKKTLIASIVFGTLVAGSAMAADMSVKAPIMKAPPPPAFSWTGCYLDAGAGYGMWNQDHSTTFINGFTSVDNTGGGRGWLGRFGAGCDYQVASSWVFVVFGDFDLMDLKGSMVPLLVNTRTGRPSLSDEKENSAWSVGARIGYLIAPMVMTYVDGGWTEARFDEMDLMTNLGVSTGNSFPAHTYQGWFVGSGFEYNFTWLPIQGLFLRTEYRFASYQKDDLPLVNAAGVPTGDILHADKQVQTVTTSLVWRFNWGGAIAARY
jgi:outer membrane immunogenic protein